MILIPYLKTLPDHVHQKYLKQSVKQFHSLNLQSKFQKSLKHQIENKVNRYLRFKMKSDEHMASKHEI